MNLTEELENFENWLIRLGYAETTVKRNVHKIGYFFEFLNSKKVYQLSQITPQIIQEYQNHLDSKPISSKTIASYLSSLRLFDKYLLKYGKAPIIKTKLRVIPFATSQRTILTQQEIKQIYQVTDQSVKGFLDRAILSIYYGCGLRATEGRNLQLQDIDFKSNLLQVRHSKTYHPRYVPMNKTVQEHLKEWIEYGRIIQLIHKSDYVLVHSRGQYKEASGFNKRLKKLLELANIKKEITLHSLRHSIATHLLENGMELEQIRQFLGHQSLEITQQYTHLVYE